MTCVECRAKEAVIKFLKGELDRYKADLVDADETINNLIDEVSDLEGELEDATLELAKYKGVIEQGD